MNNTGTRNFGRTDFSIKLKCSLCEELLETDVDKSKMAASSARELRSEVFIVPCRTCERRSTEPLRLITQALDMINKPTPANGAK